MVLDYTEDSEIAFNAMEALRKGWFSKPEKREACDKLRLPREFEDLARKFRYVFPRAHGVEYMMLYARLALAKRRE